MQPSQETGRTHTHLRHAYQVGGSLLSPRTITGIFDTLEAPHDELARTRASFPCPSSSPALAAAIELPTPSSVSAATATAATPTYTTPPLPREWRTRHYPSFDHMYANPSEPRLDWIRTPGAR